MMAIDLDHFPNCALLSKNQFNLFSICDEDHVHRKPKIGIKDNLIHWLSEQNFNLPNDSQITLITFPRVLGYSFNPVSFYYISSKNGEPIVAVAEVTNTYREMKLYVIPYTSDGLWQRIVPKNFYVSPFSNPNDTFHFQLGKPCETWKVKINNSHSGKLSLLSSIYGKSSELTSWRLLCFSIKYPFLTPLIILRIHLHAFILYLKKIPHFAKSTPVNPEPTSPTQSQPPAL